MTTQNTFHFRHIEALLDFIEQDVMHVAVANDSILPQLDYKTDLPNITDYLKCKVSTYALYVAIRPQGVETGRLDYVLDRCKVLGQPVIVWKLVYNPECRRWVASRKAKVEAEQEQEQKPQTEPEQEQAINNLPERIDAEQEFAEIAEAIQAANVPPQPAEQTKPEQEQTDAPNHTTRYTVYIGLNDKTTRRQDVRTERAVELISEAVRKFFGFGTITTATGVYTHQDGKPVVETTVVVSATGVDADTVARFAETARDSLNQESVYIEADTVATRYI